jgi:hypothetical protein
MKMIIEDGNLIYLESLRERFEENGIPAVIQGTETARMITPTTLVDPTLWVYLNEQFEDALQLIKNPSHMVATSIDVEQFYSSQPSEEEQSSRLNNLVASFFVYFLIGLFALFIALKTFGGT